jgi:hypothetical protein
MFAFFADASFSFGLKYFLRMQPFTLAGSGAEGSYFLGGHKKLATVTAGLGFHVSHNAQ